MTETNKTSRSIKHEAAQVGRFGIVGVINTAIDFIFLNIFSRAFRLEDQIANIPAVIIAMTFSFFANRHFVFKKGEKKDIWKQALEFFPITAFGLIVIQGVIIYFFEKIWLVPVNIGVSVAEWLGLLNFVDRQFIITNGVKAVATLASLVWNYVMYKKVVFKDQAH
ncbi:GtrA family protein [Candidatus Saccharibacteria bacterium]|nr:GtrA family protein [Candidatus Saccharibacteria bacterium]